MPGSDPVLTGLRTAVREPALTLAEISWRWSFGAAAIAVTLAGLAGFFESIVVTDRDLLALATQNQQLVNAALAHIFHGAGPRFFHTMTVLVPGLTLIWILAASVGRVTVLGVLIPGKTHVHCRPIFMLHVLRSLLALATLLATYGVLLFAARISAVPNGDGFLRTQPGPYLLILFVALPALLLVWAFLNWLLSLAPILAARDQAGALESMAQTVREIRDHLGAFAAASTLFGVMRLVAFGIAALSSMLSLALVRAIGPQGSLALLVLVTLGYFAVADFVYSARLTAYVEICRAAPPEAAPWQASQVATPPSNALQELPA